MRKSKVYAFYKGDDCLFIGTINEIADRFNIKKDTVLYYKTPAYMRKISNSGKYENQRILVEV